MIGHVIVLWHKMHAVCSCGWFVMWSTEEMVGKQIARHRMEVPSQGERCQLKG